MAVVVYRAVVFLWVAVTLIQGKSRPIPVVSGVVGQDTALPAESDDTKSTPEGIKPWGSASQIWADDTSYPLGGDEDYPWGADEDYLWGGEEDYPWGGDGDSQREGGNDISFENLNHRDLFFIREDDTQAPWGGGNQAAQGGKNQDPWGGDTQGPWGGDTHAPWGGDTQAPFGGDTHASWGDDTQTPWVGDTHAPWGDGTHAPWGDGTHAPWGDDAQALWVGDTHAPWGGDTQAPWVGDTHAPWVGDTHAPWVGDTHAPWVGDTHAPWVGDTHAPWVGDTHAPWVGDTHAPWGDDAQALWVGDTHAPWGGDTQAPWVGDTNAPWGGDTQGPWIGDTHAPWVDDAQAPWVDDAQAPWVGDTHAPWGGDTQNVRDEPQVPPGSGTRVPLNEGIYIPGDGSKTPSGDISQSLSGDSTQIPSSDGSSNLLEHGTQLSWEVGSESSWGDTANSLRDDTPFLGSETHNTLAEDPQSVWNTGDGDSTNPWGEDTGSQDSLGEAAVSPDFLGEDRRRYKGAFEPQQPIGDYFGQPGVSDSDGESFFQEPEVQMFHQEEGPTSNDEQDVLYFALEDILEQAESYSNEKVPRFLSYLRPMEAGHSFDFAEEENVRKQYNENNLEVEQYFDPHSYKNNKRGLHEPRLLPETPKMEDQESQEDEQMSKEMMDHLGFEVTNPLEVNKGKLYQMDMLIPEEQMDHVMRDLETNGTEGKKAISDTRYHWPAGRGGYPLVPYTFADAKVNRGICLKAMEEWMNHTCIRFEEAERGTRAPHLQFIQGNGCFSFIGRIWFYKGQHVSIGKNCGTYAAVHELGHALGLFHEQSRPDRDKEIRVNSENIQSSSLFNFEEAKFNLINNYGVKYDLTSVMHYKAKTYYNGGLTLSTINPLHQELVGTMDKLSHRDKLLVNRMYRCIDKWLKACGMNKDPCKNDGYLGVNCTCICPPGTCGENCQYLVGEYYDTFLSGCSENITVASTIQSVDFPKPIPAGVKCTKWIIPPECHQVELTFTFFSMYGRIRCQNRRTCCYWDGLEIRTKSPYTGTWYCGNEIFPGRKFIHSKGIILYYHATSRFSKGWQAQVRFLPIAGCRKQGRAGTEKPILPEELTRTVFNAMTVFSLNTAVNEFLPPKGDPGRCGLQEDFGNVHWNSPLYGFEKYPRNFSCFFTVVPNFPVAVKVKFDYFRLQPRIREACVDSVDLVEPFSQEKKFCGSQTSEILLPSTAFTARFASDMYYSYQGFNITFESLSDSACHKIINVAAGETGMITTPNYPGLHGRECVCEWWIIAPANKKIKILIAGKNIGRCQENYLVVDLQGTRSYYRPLSSRVCGENNLPVSLLSAGNEMNVVYKSMRNSKGFHIQYEVI